MSKKKRKVKAVEFPPEPKVKPRHFVVVSDTHCNSKYAVCPPGVEMVCREGREYPLNEVQEKLWPAWGEFWEWARSVTAGEPYAVVVNGDMVEGRHHGNTELCSMNMADQQAIAESLFRPVFAKAIEGYVILGTEAHSGPDHEQELTLTAALLNSVNGGTRKLVVAGKELNIWTPSGWLLAFKHHIGATSSPVGELTALMRSIVKNLVNQARWGVQAPDVEARAHRHTAAGAWLPWYRGIIQFVTTPAWKLNLDNYGSKRLPDELGQVGGIVITDHGPDEPPVIRKRIWHVRTRKYVNG